MRNILLVNIIMLLCLSPTKGHFSFDERSDSFNGTKKSDKKIIKSVDKKAEKLKSVILNSKTRVEINEISYYVSNDGDDAMDGKTPGTAFKSIEKINSLALNPGDGVLFQRGGLWRGNIKAQKGVTYSAYGKGEKPKIYGSRFNAAKEGKWIRTSVQDVYCLDCELPNDVGTLVFNDGENCAFKVMKKKDFSTGKTFHIDTDEIFNDYRDLKRDLDFFHDYTGDGKVYLCSKKGNPAERFNSIELLERKHIITVGVDDVCIDNLCLKYGGSHGIGCGKVKNVTVTNCEIGWIGGSIQFDKTSKERPYPTRFGNGVELWGGSSYTVDHCYIYQVYDAGATHQYVGSPDETVLMENIVYSNNLIENCIYSIEYFLSAPKGNAPYQMGNITIKDNIMRLAGYGWGKQRPDKGESAHIKSWDHYNKSHDFIIKDNILDRADNHMIHIAASNGEWLPEFENNIYIQHDGSSFGRYGECPTKSKKFDESVDSVISNICKDKGYKVYRVL